MKIIVLGAGQVGTSMAEILSREENDVTLVDIDSEKLSGLQRIIWGAAPTGSRGPRLDDSTKSLDAR